MTYLMSEFRKIATPHPCGWHYIDYYRHKEKKFTMCFLDMTTGWDKERGVPPNMVAHICSKDGEPSHEIAVKTR